MWLINCLEGEKELVIFWNSDIGHFIEEYVIVILKQRNPRLRMVWPEIIDDKEEDLGAGVIHWVERVVKSFYDFDSAKDILAFPSIPHIWIVEVSRCNSREVVSHNAFEYLRLVERRAYPLRSQSENLVRLRRWDVLRRRLFQWGGLHRWGNLVYINY